MNIILQPIPETQKATLFDLLTRYRTEMLGEDAGPYKYLDSYWQKPSHFPYFIKDGDKIIGFVLINNYTVIDKQAHSIAEFFIEVPFRRKGIGKIAASKAFSLHPGKWEIRELEENHQAYLFWKMVISSITNNHYKEIRKHDELWDGPIQLFEISGK